MNADPENFDDLRRLLALKRHEQPPPGYFSQLPQHVWKRIEKEEARPSFWEQWIPSFGLKPAVAYAFGLVLCGTLIIGIGNSLKEDGNSPLAAPLVTGEVVTTLPIAPVPLAGGTPPALSNDSALQHSNSLYPGPITIDVQPVGFRPE